MAISPQVLNAGTLLTASAATLYTAPVNAKAVIKRAVFTNNDTVSRTITVYRIPNGGVLGNQYKLIAAFPLAAGQDYAPVALTNLVLNAGDTVQALADVTSVVGVQIAGFVVT